MMSGKAFAGHSTSALAQCAPIAEGKLSTAAAVSCPSTLSLFEDQFRQIQEPKTGSE
jgi:hypothetical protein